MSSELLIGIISAFIGGLGKWIIDFFRSKSETNQSELNFESKRDLDKTDKAFEMQNSILNELKSELEDTKKEIKEVWKLYLEERDKRVKSEFDLKNCLERK